MRKDIEIHINTGDVALVSKNNYKLRPFRWVNNPSGLSRFIYGEIDVPHNISENSIRNNGLYFTIPYTPKYKEFQIRIRRIYEDGSYSYLINETDGSTWFLVKASIHGKPLRNVYASTLPIISETSFYMYLKKGIAELYSDKQSDFNIVKADRQNANCMLACFPGNLYRYPLTGVGLARWINSNNVISTDLVKVLQDEFAADGVTIKNAAYNYNTKQMELGMEASESD